MKKLLSLILVLYSFSILPSYSFDFFKNNNTKDGETNVFIYHLPDDGEDVVEEETKEEEIIIQSDDITADTSGTQEIEEPKEEVYIKPITVYETENGYEIDDMYSDVLFGYASFDEEEVITLDEETIKSGFNIIKIKKPAKVKGDKYLVNKNTNNFSYSNKLSKNVEYSIAPVSATNIDKIGGFSAGTTYSQFIDTSEFEQSTMFFSRYDTKHFSLTAAYAKTLNSTNGNFNDNIYITPEIKINQYFSLRPNFSTDIITNKKKAEVMLSINPFGKKDEDRFRLELGTNATYSPTNEMMKNQFKFSTRIKL